MTTTRRLAAITVADVVGYSRLMEADEAGTLVTREKPWSEVGPFETWWQVCGMPAYPRKADL